MIYILLVLIVLLCMILEIYKKNILFIPLIFALFIGQLFIIVPGSDISSASYGNFNQYKFFGMTISTIISIVLLIYCIYNIFISSKFKFEKKDLLVLIAIIIFDFLGLINGNSISERIDMCAKINMPFIIYFYLKYSYNSSKKNVNILNTTFLLINIILIVQVPICKLLTGKFSASTFYTYIMNEEYYGYYSSPHAFSALLGILSIWNLKNISNKYRIKTNYLCLVCNIILIFLSGVRTYLLSVIFAIAILFFSALNTKHLKKIKSLAIISIIVVLLCSNYIFEKLSTSRISISYNTTELTSGRTYRWKTDLLYFSEQGLTNKIVGNGFKSIYNINSKLIDVYINSLNVFIDLLIDNGILGMLLLIFIYYNIVKRKYKKSNIYFIYSILIYIGIGCFINNLLPYITVMTTTIILIRLLEIEGKEE